MLPLNSRLMLKKGIKISKAPTDKSVSASLEAWSHLGLNQGPPDYESDALTD